MMEIRQLAEFCPDLMHSVDPALTSNPLGQMVLCPPENIFHGLRSMLVSKGSEAADAHALDTMDQKFFTKSLVCM